MGATWREVLQQLAQMLHMPHGTLCWCKVASGLKVLGNEDDASPLCMSPFAGLHTCIRHALECC